MNYESAIQFVEKYQTLQILVDEMFEKTLKTQRAILKSMTTEEKKQPDILNLSRFKKVAEGSGTTVSDVVRLMKQYLMMKK